jgi:hypothetical protein
VPRHAGNLRIEEGHSTYTRLRDKTVTQCGIADRMNDSIVRTWIRGVTGIYLVGLSIT